MKSEILKFKTLTLMKAINSQPLDTVVKLPEVPKRKSKTAIFWEKNPGGIIKVIDRRAVNK